jgi:hypothetical protein
MQQDTAFADPLWNLPATAFPDRGAVLWTLVAEAGPCQKPLEVLEIGVFRAALLASLLKRSDVPLASYVGVDPYVGDRTDSYRGAYWRNPSESSVVYQEARNVFSRHGHTLERDFSHRFYARTADRQWDVIIVDGDHRYHAALWDCHHWFQRLRPGGLLLVDDYANVDTPEVTRAVNDFIDLQPAISKVGYRVLPFQNSGKRIPVSLTFVYFQKAASTRQPAAWKFEGSEARGLHPVRRLFRRFGFDVRRAR